MLLLPKKDFGLAFPWATSRKADYWKVVDRKKTQKTALQNRQRCLHVLFAVYSTLKNHLMPFEKKRMNARAISLAITTCLSKGRARRAYGSLPSLPSVHPVEPPWFLEGIHIIFLVIPSGND